MCPSATGGRKKLKAEDIGLDPDKVSDRLISLGHKRLLPKEATAALALVESRAHTLVEANTFPFLNGLAHFVPNAKLAEVTGKLKELEAEFWQAKNQFVDRYGELREARPRNGRQWPANWCPTRTAWSPPSKRPSRRSARWNACLGSRPNCSRSPCRSVSGWTCWPWVTRSNSSGSDSRRPGKRRQKIRSDAETFVADCVATFREQTAQLCEEMLPSIRTGETGVHQKTLNRLVRFIDQFKQMNFVGDAEMEQQLETVRRELLSRTAEEYRDSTARATAWCGLVATAGHGPSPGPAGCDRTGPTVRRDGPPEVPSGGVNK